MNIFSEKIPIAKQEEIKSFILENFNGMVNPKQYAFWEIKHKDFTAVFYNSGKFMLQGKDITPVLEKLSEKFSSPFTLHHSPQSQTSNPPNLQPSTYIGTDESGKGDFFGPLVIAGVLLDEKNRPLFIDLGVKDSKTLKDDNIIKMAQQIKKNSIFSVVVISNAKYNELYSKFKNLNKLLAWGHARVIENILEKADCEQRAKRLRGSGDVAVQFNASNQENICNHALSDKFGDENLIKNALMKHGRTIQLEQRVRAESDIAVAAASILARAAFVEKIKQMENFYGCKFSKGCNDGVKVCANEFIKKYSKERLNEVCKMHFKTYNEI